MHSELRTYFPADAVLKKHIHYFYFDHFTDPHFYRKYSFFPHVKTTLSFYRQAHMSAHNGEIEITHDAGMQLLGILTRQHSIKTVIQKGITQKIGIVFNPLGLNHFIDEDYAVLAGEEVQPFSNSRQQHWHHTIRECFEAGDPLKQVQMLETFLLSLYRPGSYQLLYAVMTALSDPHDTITIREAADRNYISHRSLNRDFKKHLAVSPEVFRMIVRFRHAVNQRIIHENGGNLTSLAYESGYPDQSYMIRAFRKLTGQTPSAFFKTGRHLGMADTFWKIHPTKVVV